MQLRWKTFEAGLKDMKVRNYDLFGPKLRLEKFNVKKKPILQVSYDGVTWHDVPNAPPIPYEEWSDENT
jgi:hypothetical protein